MGTNLQHLVWLVAAAGVLLIGCETTLNDGPAPDVALELVDGEWVQSEAYVEGTADYSRQQIRNAFDRQDYGQAVSLGKKHVKTFLGDPSCEEVYFLAAQSELGQKRYYRAYDLFEKQLTQYPGGEFFQQGLEGEYECAQAFFRGDRRLFGSSVRIKAEEEAIIVLNKIAAHAPGSAMAEKVILEAAEFHYADKDYVQAADAYDYFVRMFPKSPSTAHAMLRSADSTYRLYFGPEYDETPLLDARQKYESFADQFPRQAELMEVEAILEEIYNAEALRVYEAAQFYARTHKRRAAIYYYQRVVQEYPDTMWAGMSEMTLSGMGIEVEPTDEPARRPYRVEVSEDDPPLEVATPEVASPEIVVPTPTPVRREVIREPEPEVEVEVQAPTRVEVDDGPFGPAGAGAQREYRSER
jgi:outer membrane assembly lipoprotein YfiO